MKNLNCVSGQQVTIDVLIGLDSYWSCMKPGLVRAGNLVAQETVFGWVLSGTTPQVSYNDTTCVSVSLLSFNHANNLLVGPIQNFEK